MCLYAGLVQSRDVVHSHHVDRRSALYQQFELQRTALGRRLVEGRPVGPGTWTVAQQQTAVKTPPSERPIRPGKKTKALTAAVDITQS